MISRCSKPNPAFAKLRTWNLRLKSTSFPHRIKSLEKRGGLTKKREVSLKTKRIPSPKLNSIPFRTLDTRCPSVNNPEEGKRGSRGTFLECINALRARHRPFNRARCCGTLITEKAPRYTLAEERHQGHWATTATYRSFPRDFHSNLR